MYHIIKTRNGCFSFYGKNEGISIDLGGRCTPSKPLECHSETNTHLYTHTLTEKENSVVLKMSEYHKHTLKSCKEFPLESDQATCAVRIGCRLLSRPEGLGPEIALNSPEENKRGSWLLSRNLKVYFAFFILHILVGFKVSRHGML